MIQCHKVIQCHTCTAAGSDMRANSTNSAEMLSGGQKQNSDWESNWEDKEISGSSYSTWSCSSTHSSDKHYSTQCQQYNGTWRKYSTYCQHRWHSAVVGDITYSVVTGHSQRQLKQDTLTSWVSWVLTSLFSTNMAISETKSQGWRAIPTQWRKASDILTSTLAAFLFSNHPKREKDWQAHLNYYASAHNRGKQLTRRKTKLNQIRQKTSTHP